MEKSPIYALREEFKHYTHLIPSQSSQALIVDALCLKSADKLAILLVNWTKKNPTVSLPLGFQPIRFCQNWENEALVWESLVSNHHEFYTLMPGSLTLFEDRA